VNGVTTNLQHVVYTRNAAGVERFYIDNELISTTSRTGNISMNNGYTFALGNEITEDRPWLGEMHLVAVYSKALSVAEIGQNYHKGVCSNTDINVCDGNLTANGTFEQDFYGWWNTSSTIVNSGGSKVARACGNQTGFGEAALATPGKTYTLTAKARISGSPSWAGINISFGDSNNDVIGVYYDQRVQSTGYQTYSVTATAPANAYWVNISGWKEGTSGCLFVDDFCLTDGTTFGSG